MEDLQLNTIIDNADYMLAESVHTKKGTPLYVLHLKNRVEDKFKLVKRRVERIGGYYSGHQKGFVLNSLLTLKELHNLFKGIFFEEKVEIEKIDEDKDSWNYTVEELKSLPFTKKEDNVYTFKYKFDGKPTSYSIKVESGDDTEASTLFAKKIIIDALKSKKYNKAVKDNQMTSVRAAQVIKSIGLSLSEINEEYGDLDEDIQAVWTMKKANEIETLDKVRYPYLYERSEMDYLSDTRYSQIVFKALEESKYQSLIKENVITANKAAFIIESAGFEIPESIMDDAILERQSEVESLVGGFADSKSIFDIANKFDIPVKEVIKQFRKGLKVEREHTKDKKRMGEIVKDHLFENPYYYDVLLQAEKNMTEVFAKDYKTHDEYMVAFQEHEQLRANMSAEEKANVKARPLVDKIKQLKKQIDLGVPEEVETFLRNTIMNHFVSLFNNVVSEYIFYTPVWLDMQGEYLTSEQKKEMLMFGIYNQSFYDNEFITKFIDNVVESEIVFGKDNKKLNNIFDLIPSSFVDEVPSEIKYELNPKDKPLAALLDSFVNRGKILTSTMGVYFNKDGVFASKFSLDIFLKGKKGYLTKNNIEEGIYGLSESSKNIFPSYGAKKLSMNKDKKAISFFNDYMATYGNERSVFQKGVSLFTNKDIVSFYKDMSVVYNSRAFKEYVRKDYTGINPLDKGNHKNLKLKVTNYSMLYVKQGDKLFVISFTDMMEALKSVIKMDVDTIQLGMSENGFYISENISSFLSFEASGIRVSIKSKESEMPHGMLYFDLNKKEFLTNYFVKEEVEPEPTKKETTKEDLQARLRVIGKMIAKNPENKAELEVRARVIEKMIARLGDGVMAKGGGVGDVKTFTHEDGTKYYVDKKDNGIWTIFSESDDWEKRDEFENGFANEEDAELVAKELAGLNPEFKDGGKVEEIIKPLTKDEFISKLKSGSRIIVGTYTRLSTGGGGHKGDIMPVRVSYTYEPQHKNPKHHLSKIEDKPSLLQGSQMGFTSFDSFDDMYKSYLRMFKKINYDKKSDDFKMARGGGYVKPSLADMMADKNERINNIREYSNEKWVMFSQAVRLSNSKEGLESMLKTSAAFDDILIEESKNLYDELFYQSDKFNGSDEVSDVEIFMRGGLIERVQILDKDELIGKKYKEVIDSPINRSTPAQWRLVLKSHYNAIERLKNDDYKRINEKSYDEKLVNDNNKVIDKIKYLASIRLNNAGSIVDVSDDDLNFEEGGDLNINRNEFSIESEEHYSLGGSLRWWIPNVRGEWTKEKIRKALKSAPRGKAYGDKSINRFIAEFDNPQEFKEHIFYHGTGSYVSGSLTPSITMSERDAERYGGGGYGDRYWSISLSKSKNTASNFTAQSRSGTVYAVILKKGANVIDMPEIQDSNELEDIIEKLWTRGVDAVRIGDWTKPSSEQELAVINPNAIFKYDKSESYMVYGKERFENLTDEQIAEIYYQAKKNVEYMDEIRSKVLTKDEKNAALDKIDKLNFEEGGDLPSNKITLKPIMINNYRWYLDTLKMEIYEDEEGTKSKTSVSKMTSQEREQVYDQIFHDKPMITFDNGGGVSDEYDPEKDLFSKYETLPDNVKSVIDKYSEEEPTYESLAEMIKELEPLGYTFDYYLDAEPYNLRKMSNGGGVSLVEYVLWGTPIGKDTLYENVIFVHNKPIDVKSTSLIELAKSKGYDRLRVMKNDMSVPPDFMKAINSKKNKKEDGGDVKTYPYENKDILVLIIDYAKNGVKQQASIQFNNGKLFTNTIYVDYGGRIEIPNNVETMEDAVDFIYEYSFYPKSFVKINSVKYPHYISENTTHLIEDLESINKIKKYLESKIIKN